MTPDILILRKSDRSIETKGELTLKSNTWTCFTLELPWKNNENGISCIPDGLYEFEKVPASEHIPYEHVLIKDVPGRDGIKIHIANFAAGKLVQLKGCTTVAEKLVDINHDGIEDAFNSKVTFDKFMSLIPDSGIIEYRTKIVPV